MNKAFRLVWNISKNLWVVAAELVSGKGGPPPVTASDPVRPISSFIMALEPRFMFDAAAATVDVLADHSADSHVATDAKTVTDPAVDRSSIILDALTRSALVDAAAPAAAPVELAFIDPRLQDSQTLIAGIKPGVKVILLDPAKDGIAQITAALQAAGSVSAIHILGHGTPGELRIGSTDLTLGSLDAYSAELTAWQANLTAEADILLYGCDVTQGSAGSSLITALARITSADVAASTDATGAAKLGGNWTLESATGVIDVKTFEVVAYQSLLEAPAVTVPGSALTMSEDGTLVLGSNISVIMSGSGNTMEAVVTITTSGGGILRTGSGTDQVDDISLAAQGDLTDINNFLKSLSFVPTSNWFGTVTISVQVTADYTTRDAAEITTTSFDVTVNSVNDAPAGTNATLTTLEDTAIALTPGNFGFTDPNDIAPNVLSTVKISSLPGAGTLTLSGTAVTTGLEVSAANIAAGNLVYTPGQNGNGNSYSSFTFQVRDNGDTSNGGTNLDASPNTIIFNVTAVNDAPTSSDFSASINKNAAASTINLTSHASDPDANITSYRIVSVPTAEQGLLKVGGTTVNAGDTLTAANAAIMTFTPTTNYFGTATLSFQAIDSGSLESAVSTATITVTGVNVAPTITRPGGTQTLSEEGSFVFSSANSNAISVGDSDAGAAVIKLTLATGSGTVTLGSYANLYDAAISGTAIAAGTATGASLTLYGTITDLNTALASGVTYAPTTNFFGSTSIAVGVDDLGNTGGSAQTASSTISLTVNNTPDDPVTGATTSLAAVAEDSLNPAGETVANLVTGFSDVDNNTLAGIAISVNGSNGNGAWQYSVDGGASWSAVGVVTTDAALLLNSSALLRFLPTANYSGTPGTLTVHAIDNSGGRTYTSNPASHLTADVTAAATDLDATGALLSTSITAVNDLFTVGTSTTLVVAEGDTATLTSSILSITDIEAGASQIVYTLSESGSILGGGVFQKSDGAGTPTWSTLGYGSSFTQADINAGLIRISHNGSEPLGTEVLNYSVTDAVGGVGTTAPRTLNIQVTPVNDTPVLYVPGDTVGGTTLAAVVEVGNTLTFSTDAIRVIDPDNTDAQLTFRLESLPSRGYLTYNNKPVGVGSVFTYANLGLLKFIDSSGTTDGTTNFSVTLRDGAGGVLSATTVNVVIGGHNYAPNGMGTLTGSIWEDPTRYGAASNNDGKVISAYSGFAFSDKNVSGGSFNAGYAAGGYAIVGNTANAGTEGTWEYYSTASGSWSAIGSVNDTTGALVLSTATLVRFSPVPNYNGTPPALSIRVLDTTYAGSFSVSGTSSETRVTLDVSSKGGTTAISSTVNTLTITVNAVDDDPVLATAAGESAADVKVLNTYLVLPNDGSTLSGTVTGSLLASTDIDSSDSYVRYTVTAAPTQGWLFRGSYLLSVGSSFTQADINAGLIHYTNNYSQSAITDSFTVTVTDGASNVVLNRPGGIYVDGSNSTLQKIKLNITVPGTVPRPSSGGTSGVYAYYDYFTTDENVALTGITTTQLRSNDVAPVSWAVTVLPNTATNGTVIISAEGQITFTPTTDFYGLGYFQYTLTGSTSLVVDSITSQNSHYSAVSGGSATVAGLYGSVTIGANGSYTYTADLNNATLQALTGYQTVNEVFYYTANDGTANEVHSVTGSFSVTVSAADKTQVGASLPLTTIDHVGTVEESLTSISSTNDVLGQYGTLTLHTDGSYSYAVNTGSAAVIALSGSSTLSDVFYYSTVDSKTGSISVTVSAADKTQSGATTLTPTATGVAYINVVKANEAPVISVNQPLQSNEGSTVTIDSSFLLATDADGDTITFTLSSLPSNGTLWLSGLNRAMVAGDRFTQADITANRLSFEHNGTEDFISTFGFTYTDGTAAAQSGTFNIDITPVNDAPSLYAGSFMVSEGDSYTLSISGSDADGGGDKGNSSYPLAQTNTLTYTISTLPTHGQIRLYNASDSTYVVVTIGTSLASDNLSWLRYQNDSSENDSDSFIVAVNDGTTTVSRTVSVTILAKNDDPVAVKNTTALSSDITYNTGSTTHNPAPPAYSQTSFTVYEGTTQVLDTSYLKAYDPDNSDDQLQFRITTNVTHGQILLNGSSALAVGSVFTQADLIAGKVSYRHDGTETTSDSFGFTLSDAGGGLEPSGTFSISIAAVNDAPAITLPADQTASEDVELAISGISIADTDAGSNDVKVTLSVGHGTLTLASLTGLAFVTGDGTGDSSMSFTGSVSAINTALAAGVKYLGTQNYNGSDSLSITVNDQGNTGVDPDTVSALTGDDGSLTSQSTTATLGITVRSVNDAPVMTVPDAQSVNEDTNLALTGVSIADIDATSGAVQITLGVSHGTITLGSLDGLAFTTGDGASDASMVFTGTVSAVNTALAGLTYLGVSNYHGSDTLTLTVSDQNNTGVLGGVGTDTKNVAITVNPVNDAPTASNYTSNVAEDTTLTVVLSSGDVDDGTHGATTTDAVVVSYRIDTLPGHGTLQYYNGTAWVDVALLQVLTKAQGENLHFIPAAQYNSATADSFTFTVLDAAGAASDTRTASITITAVNDAPVLSGGGDSVAYTEGSGVATAGTPVRLNTASNLVVADQELTLVVVDTFESATITVQRHTTPDSTDRFGFDSGLVTLSGSNVQVVAGTTIGTYVLNNGVLTVTFTSAASKSDVETVMKSITYASVDDNLAGGITVDMTFNDGNAGTQGSGGSKTSNTITYAVTVTNTNDKPSLTAGGSITVVEDGGGGNGTAISTIMSGTISDPDNPISGSSALAGIVITADGANRVTQGYWQYSADNGANWYDVSPGGTAPTTGNALVLSAATKLRFVPVANFNSTLNNSTVNPGALTVMAIDNSFAGRTYCYTNGETVVHVDVSGLADPTSDIGWGSTRAITATVTQVNDAPEILGVSSSVGSFLAFTEASGVNIAGSALLLDSLPDGILASITDVDLVTRTETTYNGARIVVGNKTTLDTKDLYVLQTGNAVSIGGGYTLPGSGIVLFNSGSNISYGGIVIGKLTDNSSGSGQLTITFNEKANSTIVNTVLRNIAYSNRDDHYSVVTSKTIVVTFFDGSNVTYNGLSLNAQGGSQLSASAEITVQITPSNDAPVFATLVNSVVTPTGLTIAGTEDSVTTTPATPATLQTLLGGLFIDPDGVSGNTLAGVAISAYTDNGLGHWQVYLDSTWVNLSDINISITGGISTTKALLLSADTQIKFVQNAQANTNGPITVRPSISVHAVESHALSDADLNAPAISSFTSVAGTPVTYNTTTDTAGSRVSIDSVAVAVSITGLNDAPTLSTSSGVVSGYTSGVFTGTIAESALTGTGTATPQILLLGFSVADIDPSTTSTLASTVFGAGTITVSLSGRVTGDIFSLNGSFPWASGVASVTGGSTGDYVIQLTNAATLTQVNDILAAIQFQHTSDRPPLTQRSYTITLNDGNNLDAQGDTAGASALAATALTGSITIGAGNDAPVMNGGSQSLAYTENGSAAVIDATVTVASDADDTQMSGATVTISVGFTAGDVLSVATQNGISGSYDADTHVLTLTGNATLAQYTTALRSVKFNSTSDDPTITNTSRTITWQVTDAGSAGTASTASSNTRTSTITITPTPDAPTLTGTGTATYTENGTAAVLFAGITVGDVDDTQIVSAVVNIGTGFTAGDTLNFSDQNSIAGTYHSDTGILNLTGTATLVNYQTALASITFSSTSQDPTVNATATTRTLHWTVTDANSDGKGAQPSADKTSALTIIPAQDAPVITPAVGALSYTEKADATVVDATVTVADADDTNIAGGSVSITTNFLVGDVLAVTDSGGITGSYNSTTGVLTLTGNATLAQYQTVLQSLTYLNSTDDPTENNSTTRTLTYSLTDANSDNAGAATGTATKTINLTATVDNPVITTTSGSVGYTENGSAVVIDSGLTLTDADDTQMASATVTITGNLKDGDLLAVVGTTTGQQISGTTITVTSYASGVLTLTGVDTKEHYEAVLRTVTYVNTSDNPNANNTTNPLNRTITFSVTDANSDAIATAGSGSNTRVVAVTAVNDAPAITGTLNNPTSLENTDIGSNTVEMTLLSVTAVTDADFYTSGTTFNGGSVTVSFTDTYVTGDVLSVKSGSGAGAVQRSGDYIQYFSSSWTTIGTVDATDTGVGMVLKINLNSNANETNVAALLNALSYYSTSENPTVNNTDTQRAYSILINDGKNDVTSSTTALVAANSNILSGTITITPANDPPQVDLNGATEDTNNAVTWTEGSNTAHVAIAIAPSATLADVDNLNLSQMQLVVGNVPIGDSEVLNIGGTDFTLGSDHASTDVGSFLVSYVADTHTFTITRAGSTIDTLVNFQSLLRGITYSNNTNNPTGGDRTVTVTVTDAGDSDTSTVAGQQTSAGPVITITVVPVNDQPVITNLGDVSFFENAINTTAAVIDSDITVTDIDSADYNGGSLTVSGITTDDTVSLPVSAATVSGNVQRNGSNVEYYNGSAWVVIGTYTGGAGANFVVTFNASATPAIAERVIENLTFANSANNPTTSRTLTFALNDGDGQTVQNATVVVTIVRDNDAPTMTSTTLGNSYTEQATAVQFVRGTIAVGDPDENTNFYSSATSVAGSLTVHLDTYVSGDTLSVLNFGAGAGQIGVSGTLAGGLTISYGGTSFATTSGGSAADLVITFTSSTATPAAVQALLAQLCYSSDSDDPTVNTDHPSRAFTVTLNDGGNTKDAGSTSEALTAVLSGTITLIAVNDAPVITLNASAQSYTENGTAVAIDSGLTLTDADDTQMASATVTITANLKDGDLLSVAGTTTGQQISGTTITVTSYSNGILTLTGVDTKENGSSHKPVQNSWHG